MDTISRIIRAYRPDGPYRVLPASVLRRLYSKWRLDPRTAHPWAFDAESLAHFRQKGVRALFEALELTPRCKVLSLGEGNGAPSRLCAKLYGCHVTGVDVSPLQVANAKGCAALHGVEKLVDYVRQDVHELDLGGRRFDRLYANETAIHWEHKELALRRALRYLKPGALAGFNEWLRGDAGDLDEAWRRLPRHRPMYYHGIWFQFSLGEFRALLERLGFKILRCEELTDEVDASMRQWLGVLERSGGVLEAGDRLGIPYLKAMLKTHYRYLRYGRVIARAP
ncbi:MAG: methyltransferase domain-containing protein [Elusimicrobia bacterium]|nr:methyltransferase domain-containing protein [Elusimicrobiota bacterium]